MLNHTVRAGVLGVLVALAGCAGPDAGSAVPQPATVAVAPPIDWRTAYEADAVRVELTDSRSFYRVESIELVAPDGARYRAEQLTREVMREDAGYQARPSVGFGGAFGSRGGGLGIGLGIPIATGGGGGSPSYTRTVTRIAVPDPAAYRADTAGWSVRATLTDTSGTKSFAQFPAPSPNG